MSLAVVIPSRTASNLIPCMEAAWKYEHPKTPIVIVDDGLKPDDDQCVSFNEFDRMNYPLWVSGEKPFVFARNVNKGISKVPGADIVILNDDAVLLTPSGFSLLQQAAEQHTDYGIVGPLTNVSGNREQTVKTGVQLRATDRTLPFLCVFIPRRTIEAVGLLDERFTAYGWEDSDYCKRVRAAGLKVGIFEDCFVDHGSLTSTFRGNPRAPGDVAAGREIYLQKWGSLA